MQGDLEPYTHIDLTSRQHWNPQKNEFPQKNSVQEEVEGWNVSKVKKASLVRYPEIHISH